MVTGTTEALNEWNRSYANDTTCAVVREAYTFLVFRVGGLFYIIDTHHGSILRHAGKLPDYVQTEEGSTGLILRTIFFKDIINYIENYMPLDTKDRSAFNSASTQIDLTYLGLTEP